MAIPATCASPGTGRPGRSPRPRGRCSPTPAHEPLRCFQCHPSLFPPGPGGVHPRGHGPGPVLRRLPRGQPGAGGQQLSLRELPCAWAVSAGWSWRSSLLLPWAGAAPARSRRRAPRPKPGRQEESRRKLLEQVGLDKKPGHRPRNRASRRPRSRAAAARPRPRRRRRPGPAARPARSRRWSRSPGGCTRRCWRPVAAATPPGRMAAATRLVLDGNAGHGITPPPASWSTSPPPAAACC